MSDPSPPFRRQTVLSAAAMSRVLWVGLALILLWAAIAWAVALP